MEIGMSSDLVESVEALADAKVMTEDMALDYESQRILREITGHQLQILSTGGGTVVLSGFIGDGSKADTDEKLPKVLKKLEAWGIKAKTEKTACVRVEIIGKRKKD